MFSFASRLLFQGLMLVGLLDTAELRDQEILPHLLKANPHKATYNNMMLFVRLQVETFAFQKWGSAEGLDKEWERRTAEAKKKKGKKFEKALRDLRRKTRETSRRLIIGCRVLLRGLRWRIRLGAER